MNLKEIKELINLMNENELTEIEIERENGRVRLKRSSLEEKIQLEKPESIEVKEIKEGKEVEEKPGEELEKIISPMVGIFYRAPAPDADPFVNEEEEIEKGQVLCIIEAMKVMNEIKAEVSGKIKEILVENGSPVEYGQPLFLIQKK